ncbi:ANTAR domain-containing protein [Actinophytocola sp. S1-96]|uniref:ANTAR domain-containing protein n=2 Tax=Actinophytocola gossypii TaxID=2812003 RepID=A0ABT2J6M7_9PSEU|nr:ANTAR domain-containing protein [Actinophytocola gossypii]
MPATVSVLDTVDEALTREEQPVATNDVGLLATELASLTRALVDATTVGAVLRRIVTATTVIVPGADLVSFTLRDPGGGFFTPTGTDPVASALDEVQYETGAGPCVDAARLDGPAYAASDDLATELRWPTFAAAATGHGFAAVLSTDLLAHDRPPGPGGALNIYSHQRGGISTDDRYTALLLASHAALALAHVTAAELASLQRQQLLRAVETRDVIGQAKGILMARQGLTADEAFDLLRRTSQDLNVKLVDLARTLAEHPDGLVAP